MARKIPSEFVPLDVNYAHDRAIRSAGPMAELLFIRGMAYSRRTKSHGALPDYDLPVFGVGIPAVAKHAAALVREGLWVVAEGGWSIRSWAKWNPASTEEVAVRQSTGGALGNHNRWHLGEGKSNPDCEFCASDTDRYTDRSTDTTPNRSRIAEVEREKRERRDEGEPSSSSSPSVTRGSGTDMMPRAAS